MKTLFNQILLLWGRQGLHSSQNTVFKQYHPLWRSQGLHFSQNLDIHVNIGHTLDNNYPFLQDKNTCDSSLREYSSKRDLLENTVQSIAIIPFYVNCVRNNSKAVAQNYNASLKSWKIWVRILADPKYFPLGITFTGGSGNSVAPELASGSGSGLYTAVVDARLSGNKRGKSVVAVPFLTASLLG